MIQEISAALTTLSILKDTVISTIEITDQIKKREALIDFQSSLLDLQQKLFAANSEYEKLVNIKNQIETELIEYKNWDTEKQKYELQELRKGLFVYSYKKSENDRTPDHWLCPYFFDKRKKNPMAKIMESYPDYECHECGFKFKYKH